MALRYANNPRAKGRFPSYYANNNIYPGSYAQVDVPGRTSRRIHDGFDLTRNYGLDTTSDDINSSLYSSPYYVNGRYNSKNLTTQRGNSASVQGTKLLLLPDEYHTVDDFTEEDIQTYLELWQGKQIRFSLPYDGKVIGNTITLKNTGGCTGILKINISLEEDGPVVYKTAIDLCTISQDKLEHKKLISNLAIQPYANPLKTLYVRLEITDEIESCPGKRSQNPFNTGRKIEIAATGKGNHEACVYKIPSKNNLVESSFDYKPYPSRPLIGLVYSDWTPVPTERLDNIKTGASVSLNGYRYDIFCVKRGGEARMLIYDKEMNKLIPYRDTTIRVDGRVTQLNIVQCTDTNRVTWVYYVDGYSPLQKFKIGEWQSSAFESGSADDIKAEIDEQTWYDSDLGQTSGEYFFIYKNNQWLYNDSPVSLATYGISLVGGNPSEDSNITVLYTVTEGGAKTIESIEFVDARPVVGAKLIMFHNNRIYLAGFRNDPNLVQVTSIEAEGPSFTLFPYRFYVPNRSPYDTSRNPITAMVEYASDQIMITLKNGYTIYQTYGSSSSAGLEDNIPVQVSTFMDASGVEAQGDIVNYKGIIYSFNEKEGIRRFTGSLWNMLPTNVDSHYDRVDMTKPRKIWGDDNKLYFNYTDKLDGRYKCLIWDQQMNYQQYPWFQDVDVPFCDVRFDETEDLVGIHPDFPAIMLHYAEDVWRRLDSPILFRRDTKWLSLPGNAADVIVKRVHVKTIANANRWFYISVLGDKHSLYPQRGKDQVFRQPMWATETIEEPQETPFPNEDVLEKDAIQRSSIMSLRMECESVQVRVMAETFRRQFNLVSVLVETQARQYL